MVDRTVAELGRLDAAFNNAGVMAHIAPTADSSREDWDRMIGINLRGVWSCMNAYSGACECRAFLARRRGYEGAWSARNLEAAPVS
jgi:NAD(P)-dependent dehydrogenase (short-subunit alcohol dehydrogenase family)